MPSRTAGDPAIQHGRKRLTAAQILVFSLHEVLHQVAMHDKCLSTNQSLGTRECPEANAGASCRNSRRDEDSPPNRRTCLRHLEILDGIYSFPDQNAATCQHRNELACIGVQPEANDQNVWSTAPDPGNGGVIPLRCSLLSSSSRLNLSVNNLNPCACLITGPTDFAFPHSLGRWMTSDTLASGIWLLPANYRRSLLHPICNWHSGFPKHRNNKPAEAGLCTNR